MDEAHPSQSTPDENKLTPSDIREGEENFERDPIKAEIVARAINEKFYGDQEMAAPTEEGQDFRDTVASLADLHTIRDDREKNPQETPFMNETEDYDRTRILQEIDEVQNQPAIFDNADRVDHLKNKLNNLIDTEKAKVDKRYSINERVKNQYLNEAYSSLSSLYDMNPERFADLPTKEFMEIAKEYETLDIATKDIEEAQEWAREYADAVPGIINSLEGKELQGKESSRLDAHTYEVRVGGLLELFQNGKTEFMHTDLKTVANDPSKASDFLKQFFTDFSAPGNIDLYLEGDDRTLTDYVVELAKLIEFDKLDRTPRQNIEAIASLLEAIATKFQTLKDAKTKEFEELKAKYGISIPPSEESVENQSA